MPIETDALGMPFRPVMVEADRDIRTREMLLVISYAKVEIHQPGMMAGADTVQTIDPEHATMIRIKMEQAQMFAQNLMSAMGSVGVQLPSMAAEVRRMEQLIKAQEEEIKFLRGMAGSAMAYHTALMPMPDPEPEPLTRR